MSINLEVLRGLEQASDWPRVALYKARWGEPIASGIPKWYDEHGSGNHVIEFLAGTALKDGIEPWLDRVENTLNLLLLNLNIHEQGSGIYDTYYIASVCAFDHAAKRDGYPHIRAKCRQYLQNVVNLYSKVRDGKGRIIMPGKRTSPEGWDDRRDQAYKALTGERIKKNDRWFERHYNMEVGLIKEWCEVEQFNFKPENTTRIGLYDPIRVSYVEGGHIATSEVLSRCYGYPCWSAWSIHGELGNISWTRLFSRKQNERAESMGSGKPSINIEMVPGYQEMFPKVRVIRTIVLT